MADLDNERFDVVVVSTGICECIVAAALARAGKRVLQVDRNDYYGGNEATLQLKQLIEWASSGSSSAEPFAPSDCATQLKLPAEAPYGWKVTMLHAISESASKDQGDGQEAVPAATDDAPFSSADEPGDKTECGVECVSGEGELATAEELHRCPSPMPWGTPQDVLKESRRYNIDLSPSMLLCRGLTVDVLVQCGVARYLEFKSLDATSVWVDEAPRGSNTAVEHSGKALQVPCSKAAVFKSRAISISEKRQLMKFLQFCLDRQTRAENGGDGTAVAWRNERSLNQGRSLARPQNKAPDSYGIAQGADGDATAAEGENEGVSFELFLKEKCGLSPRLRTVVRCAVALLSQPENADANAPQGCDTATTASTGLRRVQRYLGALGRYGRTASLLPVYGAAEIPQAFCRFCAVHGGVFVLRERVTHVELGARPPDVAVATEEDGQGAAEGEGVAPATAAAAEEHSSEHRLGVRFASGATVYAEHVVLGTLAAPEEPDAASTTGARRSEQRLVAVAAAPLVALAMASSAAEVDLALAGLRGETPPDQAG